MSVPSIPILPQHRRDLTCQQEQELRVESAEGVSAESISFWLEKAGTRFGSIVKVIAAASASKAKTAPTVGQPSCIFASRLPRGAKRKES
eukprot:3293347-Rhodomonas_salina.4